MDVKKQLFRQILEAKNVILGKTNLKPSMAIILGTGLGNVADFIEEDVIIPYTEIPHFPTSITKGHEGNLLLGKYKKHDIVVMKGRFHLYEGYTSRGIALPIQVLSSLGIKYLIITNSAGSINLKHEVGSFMLIKDQINLTGENPLLGPNLERLGPRFPNMVGVYDPELRKKALEFSKKNKIDLWEGVYAGLKGPSFETPAEINFLRKIGADAVGMSTVLEVIAGRHVGIRIIGISCITNIAAADKHNVIHDEVIKAAEENSNILKKIIIGVIDKIKSE